MKDKEALQQQPVSLLLPQLLPVLEAHVLPLLTLCDLISLETTSWKVSHWLGMVAPTMEALSLCQNQCLSLCVALM